MFLEYINQVQKALLNFQYIEEGMKMYIDYAQMIISINLNKKIPYKHHYDALKNLPMRKALKEFQRYNDNEILIKKIQKIIENRNFVAHESFLLSMEEQNNEKDMGAKAEKMKNIADNARFIFLELIAEVEKIRQVFDQTMR